MKVLGRNNNTSLVESLRNGPLFSGIESSRKGLVV